MIEDPVMEKVVEEEQPDKKVVVGEDGEEVVEED